MYAQARNTTGKSEARKNNQSVQREQQARRIATAIRAKIKAGMDHDLGDYGITHDIDMVKRVSELMRTVS